MFIGENLAAMAFPYSAGYIFPQVLRSLDEVFMTHGGNCIKSEQ